MSHDRSRSLLLVLGLGLTACDTPMPVAPPRTLEASPSTTPPDTERPAPTSSGTSSSDTNSSDDTPTTAAEPCPAYAGFGAEGTVRTYDVLYLIGQEVVTTRWLDEDEVALVHDIAGLGPLNVPIAYTTTEYWRCDNSGASLIHVETVGMGGSWTMTFDDPALIVSADMGPDTTWQDDWSGTYEVEFDGEVTVEQVEGTACFSFGAEQTVPMTAGTFRLVDGAVSDLPYPYSELDDVWRVDPEVGIVQDVTKRLKSITTP